MSIRFSSVATMMIAYMGPILTDLMKMYIIYATPVWKSGGVKFYGVPMFMGDCITERQNRNIAQIPLDTKVLITHSPAYGILDFDDSINYGSKEILARINDVRPTLHLFGHIHAQHGITNESGITFSNGAIMNTDYTNLNAPNLLEF